MILSIVMAIAIGSAVVMALMVAMLNGNVFDYQSYYNALGMAGPGQGKGTIHRSYEGDIAAVDTATPITALGGSAKTMTVPQGISKIIGVYIGTSVDVGAAVASVRVATQLRLTGEGIVNNPHDFAGPCGSVQGVTSGNMGLALNCFHPTNIPVKAGGSFELNGYMVGEDAGDITMVVGLIFT